MGAFSWTDEELAAPAIDAVKKAWDEGLAVFVYKLRMGPSGKNDSGALTTMVVNEAIEVGWRLLSLTPIINTIGPNNEEVWITLERATA